MALRIGLPLLVAAAAFAAFVPALDGEFLNYDDDANFLSNPHYRGLSGANLKWMFSDLFGHYMPLTWLTLGLDYVLWGMNPWGYHLTSLLLHAINAVLFFHLLVLLLSRARPDLDPLPLRIAAGAGALLFAIHPLRVESVAWITERRDLVSGLFVLLTVLAYLRMCRESPGTAPRRKWLAISAGLFLASLLSKTTGMPLPLVLLVLDVFPLRRLSTDRPLAKALRPLLVEKIPFFALMAGAVILTSVTQHHAGALYDRQDYPLIQSLVQPGYRVSFYLFKTLLPWNLSPLYWYRPEWGLGHLLGWVALLGVTALLILRRREAPAALAAWISYGLLIAPVAGLFQAGPHFAADRYTYLPGLPLAALAAALIPSGSSRRRLRFAAAGAAILLAVLGLQSARQSRIWKDSIALWNHAIGLDPGMYLAYNNRGAARAAREDWEGALADYQRALRLNDGYAYTWNNRAVARAMLGDLEGSLEDFSRAIALKQNYADGLANRALTYRRMGNLPAALADAEQAVRADPRSSKAHNVLGSLRLAQGDVERAHEACTRALECNRFNAEALTNRGLALQRMGRPREALQDFTRAIEVKPRHADAHAHRGVLRGLMGDLPGGLGDLARALELKPDPQTYLRMGSLRAAGGDLPGAIAAFSEAIRLEPKSADAYGRRGVAHAQKGDPAAAAADCARALELAPPDWAGRKDTQRLLDELRKKPR